MCWHVLAGRAVLKRFFLTGTDEHGAKIEQFAKKSNVPIAQFADEAAAYFKQAGGQI